MASRYYLDSDITGVKSRYSYEGRQATIDHAFSLLNRVASNEGQIGIYRNHLGDGFIGYAIKYAGDEPYFEPAEEALTPSPEQVS